jgi:hypothetical protein
MARTLSRIAESWSRAEQMASRFSATTSGQMPGVTSGDPGHVAKTAGGQSQ